jgi:hypothetical protein
MSIKKCVVCLIELGGQKTMYCGNTCKQKHHYYRVKEQTNTYHSQTIRSLKRKLELIEMKGGSCEVCGYDKNLAALQFHHRNPNDKKFGLDARTLGNLKMEKILNEFTKCDLLCANCHIEEHNFDYTKEKVKLIIENKK